jgi:molybdate transport system substrate-binding protein
MKRLFFLFVCVNLILSLYPVYAQSNIQKEILFFCGSAVRVPMDEIIENYQNEKGVKISVIYGGSGGLLSQMELSRKGDVYLAGSPDFIIIGENKKLLIKGTDKLIAYLVPAIIVPKGNPKNIRSLEDLANKGLRIGIGNPETVCLGLYGVELLSSNKLMDKVLPNVVVFAKSCEDTAMLAVLNKVDAILGWDVFESWNPKEVEWIRVDQNKIPRIAYIPIALPIFVKDKAVANDFINYILSQKGQKVFAKWNYFTDIKEAKKFAPKATIGGEYKLPEEYFKIIRHER